MSIISLGTTHTHDNSLCLLENGEIKKLLLAERYSRVKHEGVMLDLIRDNLPEKPKKVLVHGMGVGRPNFHSELEEKELEQVRQKFEESEYVFSHGEHHLNHAACGFFNSGFDKAICIVVDGAGSRFYNRAPTNANPTFTKDMSDPGLFVEVESVFIAQGQQIKPLTGRYVFCPVPCFSHMGENMLNLPEEYVSPEVLLHGPPSVGWEYELECLRSGLDWCDAGKIMGLGQYKKFKKKLTPPFNDSQWHEKVDRAYRLQQSTQERVSQLIAKYTQATGIKKVIITGGYGLNCVANAHYLKIFPELEIYIDPLCFDIGQSVGLAYRHSKQFPKPLTSLFLGEAYNPTAWGDLSSQTVSPKEVANLLASKKVIAIFQGRSEAGQRALGNRSILCDPRREDGKEVVNRVKERESYRPFAASVLTENAKEWFDMLSLEESPYMLYALRAKQNAQAFVPSVVHVDGTSRIQTVSEGQNFHFYTLIRSFYEITGVPMLLNTSFNLAGEPLVETFEDAVKTLVESGLDYLYLPEFNLLLGKS